ncbi:hypothetical protein PCASD_03485 [Puccinia coronata f. sp. avenae]|uniref:Uncharacterized protein n=1 Tax=Puccinia coronata f. sp. avenae TaxID=200324 RepID=A0A2N5V7K0_9BASI|nr:hypothetical protein PCASD_03485 [Puccinia coronata f. sp. avenae]
MWPRAGVRRRVYGHQPDGREGTPARRAGEHQLGEQVCLPAMLVYTMLAGVRRRVYGHQPNGRAGTPARRAGEHQLGEQVCLPAMLAVVRRRVYGHQPNGRAGTPARRAGEHQHVGQANRFAVHQLGHQLGKQVCLPAMLVYTSSASRRVYGQQPLAAPARWLVSVDASTDISPWPHLLAMLV